MTGMSGLEQISISNEKNTDRIPAILTVKTYLIQNLFGPDWFLHKSFDI